MDGEFSAVETQQESRISPTFTSQGVEITETPLASNARVRQEHDWNQMSLESEYAGPHVDLSLPAMFGNQDMEQILTPAQSFEEVMPSHVPPASVAPKSPFQRDPGLSPRRSSGRPVLTSPGGSTRSGLLHRRKSSRMGLLSPSAAAASSRNLLATSTSPSQTVLPSVESTGNTEQESINPETDYPLIVTMCYRGYEVVFGTTTEWIEEDEQLVRRDGIQVLHARSRLPAFVSLRDKVTNKGATQGWIGVPPNVGHIVALKGHSTTGHLTAITSKGLVLLVTPSPCSVRRYTHGKYAWEVEAAWDVTDLFVNPASPPRQDLGSTSFFQRKGLENDEFEDTSSNVIDIALSLDDKVLLAYHDQLVVLDLSEYNQDKIAHRHSTSVRHLPELIDLSRNAPDERPAMDYSNAFANVRNASSVLAWTKKLSDRILAADMAGDGGTIACVLSSSLQKNKNGLHSYGVHTFVHDGSSDGINADMDESLLHRAASTGSLGHGYIPMHSSVIKRSRIRRGDSIGIIYTKGSFLPHAAPVTSIEWRSKGHTTSTCNPVEHNDLLLTHCASDSSFRVYSQAHIENQTANQPILHWMAPPYSVATWVEGISLANLGDLMDPKTGSISNEDIAMGSSASLQNSFQNSTPLMHNAGVMSNATGSGFPVVPTTAAGAWICEVTFRGSFPALRLSRLSFVRGTSLASGNNSPEKKNDRKGRKTDTPAPNPAHFESVAVMLPPGILPGLMPLKNRRGDGPLKSSALCRALLMSVQGVWSTWDSISSPSSSSSTHHQERWMGGSHAPPSELRVVASHAAWGCNKLTVLDFPLWGESELGINVEFGTPIRHFLSLTPDTGICSETRRHLQTLKHQTCLTANVLKHKNAVMRMPSATLLARVHSDGNSILLEYRQEATLSLLPLCHGTYDSRFVAKPSINAIRGAVASIGSNTSICSDISGAYMEWDESDCTPNNRHFQRYVDASVTPMPLLLPSLFPYESGAKHKASTDTSCSFHALHWWPMAVYTSPYPGGESGDMNESYFLIAITRKGTIVVYEVPPPYSATEPAMPSFDPNNPSSNLASVQSATVSLDGGGDQGSLAGNGSNNVHPPAWNITSRSEYEVNITPHHDFGIGLRLESRSTPNNPLTNEVAIAGSFKKHPLSGSRLPAEKSGMIVIGDALVGVNGVDLSSKTFDEVIDTVRQESANVAKRNLPLKLKFRPFELYSSGPMSVRTIRNGSISGHSLSGNSSVAGNTSVPDNVVVTGISEPQSGGRRSIEEILGIHVSNSRSPGPLRSRLGTTDSVLLDVNTSTGVPNNEDSDYESASGATVQVGAEAETQQEFGRVVGVNRLLEDLEGKGTLLCSAVLPFKATSDTLEASTCVLVFVNDSKLFVIHMKLKESSSMSLLPEDNITCTLLGSEQILGNSNARIVDIEPVQTGTSEGCVAVTDNEGLVHFLFFSESLSDGFSVGIHKRSAFKLDTSGFSGLNIRPQSLDLLATFCPSQNAKNSKVTIWTSWPKLATKSIDEEVKRSDDSLTDDPLYRSHEIAIPFPPLTNEIICDVQWISPAPTAINTSPLLAILTSARAILYRLQERDHWVNAFDLQYSSIFDHTLVNGAVSPVSLWPHLTAALHALSSNTFQESTKNSEVGLISDWHPDSFIAFICCDSKGVYHSMRKSKKDPNSSFVSSVIHWLSKWMSPDEAIRPLLGNHVWLQPEHGTGEEEKNPGLGNIVPFNTLRNSWEHEDDNSEESDGNVVILENAASLMALLNSAPRGIIPLETKQLSEEEILLQELVDNLKKYIHTHDTMSQRDGMKKNIVVVSLATKSMGVQEDTLDDLALPQLPKPLAQFNINEIICLSAIVDLYRDPPQFEGLDQPGQLALFAMDLARLVTTIYDKEESKEKTKAPSQHALSNPLDSEKKRSATACAFSSQAGLEDVAVTPISSGAALSALVSNNQIDLLSRCRSRLSLPNQKMDWITARRLFIPFWLRDIEYLKKVSEEIALNIFKETRDVMECALLFVAMRKIPTLSNLARTDDSQSGKTFMKFLMNHNFSTPKGRSAAEKNAFSLLRKRRYGVAAAFFLMAEPPLLSSALEVIIGNMEDAGLALLVSRLIDDARSSSFSTPGGIDLSKLGRGGGFASLATPVLEEALNEEPYAKWKPKLNDVARRLLKTRAIPKAEERKDFPMVCMLNLWIGDKTEAFASLVDTEKFDNRIVQFARSESKPIEQHIMPVTSLEKCKSKAAERLEHILLCVNSRIDFASRFCVLHSIKAPKRVQCCAALQIARGLSSQGIELPAFEILIQTSEISENDDTLQRESTVHILKLNGYDSNRAELPSAGAATSSIFDSFDPPRQNAKTTSSMTSGNMSSSIFDDFDAPKFRPKKIPAATPSQGDMSSSIFDDFEAPISQPKRSQVPAAASGSMSSSIFDEFDVPRTQPKKLVPPALKSGEMNSSIFDNFDPPRSDLKKSNITDSVIGEMSSSIFDNFDTPRTKSRTSQSNTQLNLSVPNKALHDTEADSSTKNTAELLFIEKIVKCTPELWESWRASYLIRSVARRLLREIARVCSIFYGDVPDPNLNSFRHCAFPLVPHGAAEVVQHQCDIDVVTGMRDCLSSLCRQCNIEKASVVEYALKLLQNGISSGPSPACSILFQVIIHLINDRPNLAGIVVSETSKKIFLFCEAMSIANDDFRFKRRTKFHMSSQITRRYITQVSWQLELCLWLYRGGNLPLSSDVMKDAIAGARVGILISSWARCHETLENVVKCEPDCLLEYESGRQLWTSWKMMNKIEQNSKTRVVKSSGGWEFLVDCKRSEATEMLKDKKTGTFLLRPHPEDHGVFTLSFKTNLVPSAPQEKKSGKKTPSPKIKPILPDDVVQHAIVRLSDAGFRCGSFGPFGSLMKLLEAVSSSLPFNLLFDSPPSEGIIKDEGEQPSPNSFLFRKLALHSKTQRFKWSSSRNVIVVEGGISSDDESKADDDFRAAEETLVVKESKNEVRKRFGYFTQLLAMSEATRQICAIFGAEYEEEIKQRRSSQEEGYQDSEDGEDDDNYTLSIRTLRPLIDWRRAMEVQVLPELAPGLAAVLQTIASLPVAVDATDSAIEAIPSEAGSNSAITGGDAVIRRMIQGGSSVSFHSLRVGEGGHSAMIVLFKRDEAIPWIVASGTEKDERDAIARLKWMEKRRVIEAIDLEELMTLWHGKPPKKDVGHETKNIRYRFIDPWEVQPLESREAECEEAILGRESYVPFSVLTVAQSCERMLRSIGGMHLLSLWNTTKGGIFLTKAIASVLPPWERDAGSDLNTSEGVADEPVPLISSVRRHLYRNHIFRRLRLPQRFLALVQVEMLDLKNLTSPGGTSSISAYCLLRLQRKGATAPLTHKAKPLDSLTTEPKKIGKSSGPNAPASWGVVVRFRFPLPEDVDCDGASQDIDREMLFKGPPSLLQIAVYEKKFISDVLLGTADVNLEGLSCSGGLEEWVPLKGGKTGITWFTRLRISLRFELMCINGDNTMTRSGELFSSSSALEMDSDNPIKRSVGLQKIYDLCQLGGAHEDAKQMRHSESTPDFFGYFESMVAS